MSEIRPLPARPSVAFDRKQSKALLKLLHAGDPIALQRASEHVARSTLRATHEWKLADAQRIIAREYGFATWPKLVDYYTELERHRHAPRHNWTDRPADDLEREAEWLVRRHTRRDPIFAREFAQYVPRCYGRSFDEIFTTTITLDDTRLTIARRNRCASWDELLERAAAAREWQEKRRWQDTNAPERIAWTAIRNSDVSSLAAVLDQHPELLVPSDVARGWRSTVARHAVQVELFGGNPDPLHPVMLAPSTANRDARRVTDLLASRGADVQRELNEQLLGWWPMDRGGVDVVRWMLDRGADPHWTPPNGISVIEHAIARFRDAACVDLIAARVTPKPALWIAAGLGDVAGVRRFIARTGTLAPAGRRHRPDLIAMGVFAALPPRHDADDLEIMWEAFRIAGHNGRWHTMDALLEAGLPVDHAPLGTPLLLEAVPNFIVPLAEYLISRGADLDREWPQVGGSARGTARSWVENLADASAPDVQRMLDLCGAGTVAEILGARDAAPREPITLDPFCQRALQLAADDAAELGQAAVSTENMLVGLLRVHGGAFVDNFVGWGVDMGALRSRVCERLRPDADPLAGAALPMDLMARTALRVATETADSLRRDGVYPLHLLFGIMSEETGAGARLLSAVGATSSTFKELFASVL